MQAKNAIFRAQVPTEYINRMSLKKHTKSGKSKRNSEERRQNAQNVSEFESSRVLEIQVGNKKESVENSLVHER